jgi:hypothetical protein
MKVPEPARDDQELAGKAKVTLRNCGEFDRANGIVTERASQELAAISITAERPERCIHASAGCTST